MIWFQPPDVHMYFVVAHKSDSESRAHKQSKFQSRGIEELSLRRLHRYVIWNFVMSIVYKWITSDYTDLPPQPGVSEAATNETGAHKQ